MPPPIQVNYDGKIAWGSASNNLDERPYDFFRVHGSGSAAMDMWGLLDTGADDLMLDMQVARNLQFDLSNCNMELVTVATGHIILLPRMKVDITLRGKRVTVDAIFGAQTPLIGRRALLKAIEFGADKGGWLYKVI
jgi:predicted aspartyl protease